ncbi:MAG: VOC family protein, partial [Clostridiales bacterium]|nr:VOC family protein [Clostridiales bacterium]
MMMIHGIAHTAYKVRDMEASLRFYLNGLGMQHAFSLANKENRPWIEYLCVAPGQFIELFYPEGKAVEEDTRYMHLCLQIDDLPAYVA